MVMETKETKSSEQKWQDLYLAHIEMCRQWKNDEQWNCRRRTKKPGGKMHHCIVSRANEQTLKCPLKCVVLVANLGIEGD